MGEAKFCPSCGTAADGVVAQQTAPAMDARQKTMQEAKRMLDYFSPKESLYTNVINANKEVADMADRSATTWIIAAVISLLIGLFSKAVFFYVLIVPCVALFFLKRKKNKENLIAAIERLDKFSAELQQFYDGYGYCQVGLSNTYPPMLRILCGYVEEGDASTFAEAIKCHKDEQRHLEQMEKLNQIQQSTEDAARNAGIAATVSTLDLIFK